MAPAGTMIIHVVKATVPPGDTGTKRACVKLELRDGPEDRQKVKTKMQDVDRAMCLTFSETFEFDVNETYSGELRLQLFKRKSIMGDKAAVANAGVYVKNVVSYINSNGSIDKEFKLFSKEGEALGGNVRLKIDFKPADPTTPLPADTAVHGGMKSHAYTEDEAAAKLQARFRGMKTRKELDEKKKKGGVKGAVVAVVAVAVAGAGAMLVRKRGKEKR